MDSVPWVLRTTRLNVPLVTPAPKFPPVALQMGAFMIMGSFDRIATETVRDHAAAPRGTRIRRAASGVGGAGAGRGGRRAGRPEGGGAAYCEVSCPTVSWLSSARR